LAQHVDSFSFSVSWCWSEVWGHKDCYCFCKSF